MNNHHAIRTVIGWRNRCGPAEPGYTAENHKEKATKVQMIADYLKNAQRKVAAREIIDTHKIPENTVYVVLSLLVRRGWVQKSGVVAHHLYQWTG